MKVQKILTLIGIVAVLCGCTERIDIPLSGAPSRLVIYGHISTETMSHEVMVTRSDNFSSIDPPKGIKGARVTISCSDGTVFYLARNLAKEGSYLTAPNVYGEIGKEYTLNVEVDSDGDGRAEKYTASATIPNRVAMSSIAIRQAKDVDPKFSVMKDVIVISIFGTLPQHAERDKNYYSLHASRNDNSIDDSLSRYVLMDYKMLNKIDPQDGAHIYFLDQEDKETKLESGDKVTLRIDVVTEDYGLFLRNAKNEVKGKNPIFGGPPANVKTNIRLVDGYVDAPAVVGYFSAYSSSQVSEIYSE